MNYVPILKKLGRTFQDVYFKLEADNNFRQSKPFTGFDTETSTPAYTLFNAGLGADITSRQKQRVIFGIHIVLSNIGDKAYQQHLSRLKYTDINNATGRVGVFNTGRNFSVKVNVPLEWKTRK